MRDVFTGRIAGMGSASGTRFVLGIWDRSPYGRFADAMIERADGHRILVAPSDEVAAFISATYSFDEIRIEPCTAERTADGWRVDSPSLQLAITLGARMPLGLLLRLVPRPIASAPAWARLIAPVASRVVRGVRTVGIAREGRREYYGATDLHRVTAITGSFEDTPVGELRDVDPPCRFGFSSTPRTPSLTTVTTTVERTSGVR